jgi:hypothetical protein
MKISKVRKTDYRPPSAGEKRPLERQGATRGGSLPALTGLDYITIINTAEMREHDKSVAGLPRQTLEAIIKDLGGRHAYDRKNHEHRWIMSRTAAALRAIDKMGGKR